MQIILGKFAHKWRVCRDLQPTHNTKRAFLFGAGGGSVVAVVAQRGVGRAIANSKKIATFVNVCPLKLHTLFFSDHI